jgi:hypothetical protein
VTDDTEEPASAGTGTDGHAAGTNAPTQAPKMNETSPELELRHLQPPVMRSTPPEEMIKALRIDEARKQISSPSPADSSESGEQSEK